MTSSVDFDALHAAFHDQIAQCRGAQYSPFDGFGKKLEAQTLACASVCLGNALGALFFEGLCQHTPAKQSRADALKRACADQPRRLADKVDTVPSRDKVTHAPWRADLAGFCFERFSE